MLVFDLTQRESFANLDAWLEEVRAHSSSAAVPLLVGNKSDRSGE